MSNWIYFPQKTQIINDTSIFAEPDPSKIIKIKIPSLCLPWQWNYERPASFLNGQGESPPSSYCIQTFQWDKRNKGKRETQKRKLFSLSYSISHRYNPMLICWYDMPTLILDTDGTNADVSRLVVKETLI